MGPDNNFALYVLNFWLDLCDFRVMYYVQQWNITKLIFCACLCMSHNILFDPIVKYIKTCVPEASIKDRDK